YLSDGGGTIGRYDGTTGEFLGNFASGLGALGYLLDVSPQDEATASITVNDVAPNVTVRSDAGTPAAAIHLASSVSDVGTLDTITYAWSVTNGVAVGSTTGTSFTFTPGAGTITVTLTVTDDDLGATTVKTQVIVGTAGDDNLVMSNPAAGTGRVVVFALAGN